MKNNCHQQIRLRRVRSANDEAPVVRKLRECIDVWGLGLKEGALRSEVNERLKSLFCHPCFNLP